MITQPFTREEYEARLKRVQQEMERRKLDLLILTSPENTYYLTGYHTNGIVAYQYLAVPLERVPVFMTRRLDMGNFMAIAEGIPIGDCASYDDHGDPVDALVELLRKNRLGSGRIGVEKRNLYLEVEHYERLKAVLSGSEFVDASTLVEELRLIKSPAEVEYHRQAARIAVKGMQAAIEAIRPGGWDNGVAAAALSAMINAGGEWIANWPYVKVGRQTGRGHSTWQNAPIVRHQPVTVELAGVVARYHSPLYRTVIFGPSDEQRGIAEVLREANRAGIEAMGPGKTAGEVYSVFKSLIDGRGCGDLLMHRSGYCIGIGFPPNWVQRLGIDIVRNSKAVLQPGMVFHVPTYLCRLNEFGMGQSSTVFITKDGYEDLTAEMERGPILVD